MSNTNRWFEEGLENKVTVYVPSTVKVDQALNEEAAEEAVNRTQRFLADLFGGTTSIRAQGAWVDQNGNLVVELVTLVYSFSDDLATETLERVRRFCEALRDELEQEAVAVEINGKLRFI